MTELLALLVGIPASLATIHFGYRTWRWSLARMYLEGYAIGFKHGKEGFPVAPVAEGEPVPTVFLRGLDR